MNSYLINKSSIVWLLLLFIFLNSCQDKISLETAQVQATGTSDAFFGISVLDSSEVVAVGGLNAVRGTVFEGSKTDSFTDATLFTANRLADTTYMTGSFGAYFTKVGEEDWQKIQLTTFTSIRACQWHVSGVGLLATSVFLTHGEVVRMRNRHAVDTLIDYGAALADVAFVAPNRPEDLRAVAVGYGLILFSDNGGRQWETLDITGDFFRAITFPTPAVGYIVGAEGSILKSIDGGKTWNTQRGGGGIGQRPVPFRDVVFRTANEGYIVGEGSLLWRTIDGGANWQAYQDLPKGDYHAAAVSPTELWVAGSDGLVFYIPWSDF